MPHTEQITAPERDPLREFCDTCHRRIGWIRAMGIAASMLREAGHFQLSNQLSMLSFKPDLVHIDDFEERMRDVKALLQGWDHPAITSDKAA